MTKANETNKKEEDLPEEVKVDALDLSFFMPGAADESVEAEEIISKRIKDGNGDPVVFRFKAITTEEVEYIEDNSMKNVIRNNKVVGKEVDQGRFMARIAVESTVYPNFKDSALRKAYKTEDPVEIAKKILHIAGEYSEWVGVGARVNGFGDSIEDLEDEIKN